ncbi:hypothetical protein ACFY7A_33720 [Streptomyces longwoodensis]|uniref:hypothetical protein n=1 Tax=Streptomyces longwoodensis TaxID=68231 RepID=UPI00369FBD87
MHDTQRTLLPGPGRRGARARAASGLTALAVACLLALTGCQSGDDGEGGDARAGAEVSASVLAASPSGTSPTPAPEPTPSSAAPTPVPTVPTLDDHSGRTIGRAVAAARRAGLTYAVYLQGTGASLDGGGRRASSWGAREKVCSQLDDPDDVTGAFDVAFVVARDGRDCAGKPLYTPKPTPEPVKTSGGTTGGSGGGGSGGGSTGCALTSPAGNCYADGQFCAARHHGMSTYGKGGEYLTCEQDAGGIWRWSDGRPG